MARTIDASMQAIINGHTKRPSIAVSIQDHVLHYASYQSSANPDELNDACIASDNSIIRVSITRGGTSFDRQFQYQRITDPSVGSQWSTWTGFSGGTNNIFQDGGCAVSNNSGTIRAFAQRGTGGNNIWVWTSTDNGVTWSGPVSVLSPPGSALTKGMSSAGNNDIFFQYDVSGGDQIGSSFWNGSAWSAIATATLTVVAAGGGLAVVWNTPTNKYSVIYSDNYSLKAATCNSAGGGWAGTPAVAPATSTAITRFAPRITSADSLFTLICIEADSGTLTGSVYSYPRMRQSADMVHWSNGTILHDLNGTVIYGATAFKTAPQTGSAGTRYYITTKHDVYSVKAFSSLNPQQNLGVSAAILSYKRVERWMKPAMLDLLIDNSSGQYNGTVYNSGIYKPIGPNTSIYLNEGYLVGTPPTTPDTIQVGIYRIQQIHFERTPQDNVIRLVALDRSRMLDFQSRYQMTWTNQTVSWLITELCARAGLFSVSLPVGKTQLTQTVPTFTMHAGQAYRKALDEMCVVYGLLYFMDQNEVMQFQELASSDTSVWSYQPEIELVSFVTNDLRANHIIVSGKPPTGGALGSLTTNEAYDDANNALVGEERLVHVVDPKLTTAAQCAIRSSLQLAEEQRFDKQHIISVPANPSLQVLDPITLTDSAAPTGSGQSGVVRIIEQTITYNATHAEYNQHIALISV